MKKKKLFILIFSSLLSTISLPLLTSCSTSNNQQSNTNNSNDNTSNNETDKDEKSVPDIVSQVNTKYFVDKHSGNKLFFIGAITKSSSDLSNTDINNIKNILFPNGNWTSKNNNSSITTYEAENFNDIELFEKFLKYDVLTNTNNSSEVNLDTNDINYSSIGNSNNIIGFFEIVETRLDDKTQREISLVIQLAKGKIWKSNSENYSIIFTYTQTVYSGS